MKVHIRSSVPLDFLSLQNPFDDAPENAQRRRLDRRIVLQGKSAATCEPAVAEEGGRPDARRG
jgi:hypothetical protein